MREERAVREETAVREERAVRGETAVREERGQAHLCAYLLSIYALVQTSHPYIFTPSHSHTLTLSHTPSTAPQVC